MKKKSEKSTVERISIWIALGLCLMTVFGCSNLKPEPDPLAGFYRADEANLAKNKAIVDDYEDYLQKLPPKQQGPTQILFYENQAGQHAVWMEIFEGNENASWQHVLIYDRDNKRIKVVRCGYVKYES